ncbi:MAG: hypothetical protein PVI90_13915, partial [Desulfobacteraceae bacterium]
MINFFNPKNPIPDGSISVNASPKKKTVLPKSFNLFKMIQILGIDTTSGQRLAQTLPFTAQDTTTGAESEYQTAVEGNGETVDLACEIWDSSYFRNLKQRAMRGDTPRFTVSALEAFLSQSDRQVWENSWVRLPRSALCPYTEAVFREDLRSDKSQPNAPERSDACRFFIKVDNRDFLRLPISYLLKLSLADAIGRNKVHPTIRETGEKAMSHFLSDNTSPETFSFHPVANNDPSDTNKGIAQETALRFLLSQLLIQYANLQFGLLNHGQRAILYFAPHPPVRQKKLNNLISDSFYRSLFMSPCLSGWKNGEAKHNYMHLCHTLLSRSQLNAVIKLREAGIVANNLVVLPNTSNISLANNGTHISLGSRKLTQLLADPKSGFGSNEEKYYGDLVIKIVEHFLSLFVGTYSAAPYRMDFIDFHPERVLGFLPHELDFTHLRMLWRRWKKKARLQILGRSFTPFGPELLDRSLARCFRLKGDFVPDFRLIDYLVALMSTDESPALNGMPENETKLKEDLSDMGVFDPCMPLYLLYRTRYFKTMGFSGFEGRHYSLFENLTWDMGHAANLQVLITALAYKYIFSGKISHTDIPDHPFVESERRQIFFGAAIGIPTFYVKHNTPNRLLAHMVKKTKNIRSSRRYTGYIRVPAAEFRYALLNLIRKDFPDLIEMGKYQHTIQDLEERLTEKDCNDVSCRITRRICKTIGVSSPMKLTSDEFNTAAESFYRNQLKKEQIGQALDLWCKEVEKLDGLPVWRAGRYNRAL